MAKREIPLFIYDKSRSHKLGECDFVVCTDKDNGFIAKVDYVDGEIEEVGVDYRIGVPNFGISLRIKIIRVIGTNPTEQATRTLLKSAMKHIKECGQLKVNIATPTVDECIKFLSEINRGNMAYISEGTLKERNFVASSIMMMQHCINYLETLKNEK